MNFSNPKEKISTPVSAPAKRRRRLFRKYIAFFVFLVCLALLSNNFIELRFLVRDYTAFAVRLQHEQAQSAANKIEEFIKDIEDQIRWTTHLPWPVATLEEWQLDASRLLYQVPAITEYIKVDANGREQLRTSRFAPDSTGSGNDFSRDPRATLALANMVYHGPVSFRRESEPYMTISMSGPGKDVSIAEINLKFVWDVVSQIRVGERGRVYVVDDNGRLIAHPDLNLVLRDTNVSQLRQVRPANAAERVIRLAEKEIVESFDGRQVLDASVRITSLNWRLFVELPRDEALAPIEALLQRSVIVLITALVIATLAGLLLAHKMVAPIQILQAGAARIASGHFDRRIVIKTGDELEALAEQFNLMAADVEEAHANLQMKVELRTAELSAANNRLAAAAERLRQTNVFKNEILGIVAHDLKNPMSVILGRAELLAEMIETSSPRDKLVAQTRSIRIAGKQLTEMVDSMLADALADAHEISIRRTAINISTLIEEAAETYRPLANKKGQTLTVEISINMTAIGDHDRLREAIDNLVSNAIKYTPLAGHIDLAVTRQRGHALIRVVDDGPGLIAADLTRLFGRFQRLSAKPTGGESSTGLGLSIVKRIVDLHGGNVFAESAGPGLGTTFTISLPLTEGDGTNTFDADRLSDARSVPVNGPRNRFHGTILLIEDESVVREALEDLLRLEGIRVLSTTNGDEAVALVSGKVVRPDLIISDYNLPGAMNGVESIEALRRALAREIPGIVLTGDMRPSVLKAISRHKVGIAPKPFEVDELLRLIAPYSRGPAPH